MGLGAEVTLAAADLEALLGGSLFAALLVFVRLGAALLLLPAWGEPFVPPRVRLLFALTLSLVVAPAARPFLPPQPGNPADLTLLILGEILVGLFIGTVARTLLSALDTAGMLIANTLGLSAAQAFNPALAALGNPLSGLLAILGVLVILATDLHHLMVLGLVDSYSLFVPGQGLLVEDAAGHISRVAADSFAVGAQLAAPFIVLGVLVNLGLGLISRLVPQVQVFFVGLPAQLAVGLIMLSLGLSALMLHWRGVFEASLRGLLAPA